MNHTSWCPHLVSLPPAAKSGLTVGLQQTGHQWRPDEDCTLGLVLFECCHRHSKAIAWPLEDDRHHGRRVSAEHGHRSGPGQPTANTEFWGRWLCSSGMTCDISGMTCDIVAFPSSSPKPWTPLQRLCSPCSSWSEDSVPSPWALKGPPGHLSGPGELLACHLPLWVKH